MPAFKNDTQRGGARGFGTQGMASDSGDDYLELDRIDNPQQPRKAFANKQQSVVGAYTADGDSGMGKDPVAKPSSRIMQRTLGDY
jgi:hypothetical protein